MRTYLSIFIFRTKYNNDFRLRHSRTLFSSLLSVASLLSCQIDLFPFFFFSIIHACFAVWKHTKATPYTSICIYLIPLQIIGALVCSWQYLLKFYLFTEDETLSVFVRSMQFVFLRGCAFCRRSRRSRSRSRCWWCFSLFHFHHYNDHHIHIFACGRIAIIALSPLFQMSKSNKVDIIKLKDKHLFTNVTPIQLSSLSLYLSSIFSTYL